MMRDRASYTGMPDPIYKPSPDHRAVEQKRERRRAWFNAFNAEAGQNNAWVITTPNADVTVIECLPSSPWPAERAGPERGYPLEEIAPGERVLAHGITEEITRPGSTAVARVTHAGIVKTRRYQFRSP
jgi:hypothetical protein